MLKRTWARTIWSPGMLDGEDRAIRSMKRVVLPIVDVAMLYSGLSAIRYGAPSIEKFLPPGASDMYGAAFAAAGVLALIGISFPALWVPELLGKLALWSLSIGYVGAMFMLAYEGDEARNFVIGYVAVATALFFWRLGQLGSEWHGRRAMKKKKRSTHAV
jgi:hypothetical protein